MVPLSYGGLVAAAIDAFRVGHWDIPGTDP
jgi:hypothetical protein